MVFRWTSRAAPRSMSWSMARPPRVMSPGPAGADDGANLLGVLKATMRGADGSHVQFVADSWSHSDDDAGGARGKGRVPPFYAACAGHAHANSLTPPRARATRSEDSSRAAFRR